MTGILIIDESTTYRSTIASILGKRFPEVPIWEAGDSSEGLAAAKRFDPKLAIIDIHLQEENGLELTRKVKAAVPGCYVVVTTDYNLPEYKTAATQSGGDSFFSKDTLSCDEILKLARSIFQ